MATSVRPPDSWGCIAVACSESWLRRHLKTDAVLALAELAEGLVFALEEAWVSQGGKKVEQLGSLAGGQFEAADERVFVGV